MARHAIIDKNNIVVNIVIWEGGEWLPPRNHTVIKSDSANIGDKYIPESGLFENKIVISEDPIDIIE